jgi:hypothetical protein
MTAVFVNERNLIIAKEVQRRAKETNDTIASSLKLDRSSKKESGDIVPIVGARTQDQMKRQSWYT